VRAVHFAVVRKTIPPLYFCAQSVELIDGANANHSCGNSWLELLQYHSCGRNSCWLGCWGCFYQDTTECTNMIRCLAQRPNLGIDCPDMLHWRTVHHVGACLRPMSKLTHRTDRSCVNVMILLLNDCHTTHRDAHCGQKRGQSRACAIYLDAKKENCASAWPIHTIDSRDRLQVI
jgi:hypothetical protein